MIWKKKFQYLPFYKQFEISIAGEHCDFLSFHITYITHTHNTGHGSLYVAYATDHLMLLLMISISIFSQEWSPSLCNSLLTLTGAKNRFLALNGLKVSREDVTVTCTHANNKF